MRLSLMTPKWCHIRRTHSNALYLKRVLGFVFQIKPIPLNVGTAYIYIYFICLYPAPSGPLSVFCVGVAPLFAIRMSCLPVLSSEVVCRVFVRKDRHTTSSTALLSAKFKFKIQPMRVYFLSYLLYRSKTARTRTKSKAKTQWQGGDILKFLNFLRVVLVV